MKGYKQKQKMVDNHLLENVQTCYDVWYESSSQCQTRSTREHARKLKRQLESNGHKDVVIIQNVQFSTYVR